MLEKKLNAHGISPPPFGSPQMRELPNRYYVIIALSEGAVKRDGTVPSFIIPLLFLLPDTRKSPEPKNNT